MIKPSSEYHGALATFVAALTNDLKKAHEEKGYKWEVFAFVETGRKFDKILIKDDTSVSVRYFVQRSNGTIYGAKSRFAPNIKWYFGTVFTSTLWFWGDFHGHPVNDPSVRAIKGYGAYTHYMKV